MVVYIKLLLGLALLIKASSTLQRENSGLTILTISDIHLNHEQNSTMDIDPLSNNNKNDLDLQTFFELSYVIKQNIGTNKLIQKPPDIILFLGDAFVLLGHA